MVRAVRVAPAGDWPAAEAADSMTLDHHQRHRRRLRLRTDGGAMVLLDLPATVMLQEGDGLALDDGRWVAVHAAAEEVAEIRAADAALLLRLAWHIGNRHFPAQLLPDRLLIPRDHVIEEMVRGLGGLVRVVERPFTPESGAYAGGHDHAHGPDTHTHD